MLRTLHGKLALALLGLLTLVGVLFVGSTLHTSSRYQQEVNQKVNAGLAAKLVQETDLMFGAQVDSGELSAVAKNLAVTNPGVELYLVAADGRILGSSLPASELGMQAIGLEQVERFLAGAESLVLGSDPSSPGVRKPFSAARVPAAGELQGYLYVVLADAAQESVAGMVRDSYVLRLTVAAGLAVLLLVFAAGYFIFLFLTRRLDRLSRQMRQFGNAGGERQEPGVAADEVAQLENAFRELTTRVNQQLDELNDSNRLRRELLANISHDLRTPLAALRGYLETLQMKEGRLSPEEARRYLQVADRHADRLERLISDLFELARLESGEVPVRPEPLALEELVQDVLQKFGLVAESKDVELRAECPRPLPFAVADIGLIERVLTNLVDNAIRYSPAGGGVTVTLCPAHDSVEVTVSDTGPGIAEEDMDHIFDRFYRADRYGPLSSDGAGLGLAIVKRVIELHGQTIEVASRPQQGTAFSFRLPALATG